jgi:hypothetical protein
MISCWAEIKSEEAEINITKIPNMELADSLIKLSCSVFAFISSYSFGNTESVESVESKIGDIHEKYYIVIEKQYGSKCNCPGYFYMEQICKG